LFRLAAGWNPIDPQSACLARDVYLDDTLVGRIVDTTAEIYLTNSSNIRIFEVDLLRDQIWETGDERFTEERSALQSLETRLSASARGTPDLLPK
jgi:hypothetical protein